MIGRERRRAALVFAFGLLTGASCSRAEQNVNPAGSDTRVPACPPGIQQAHARLLAALGEGRVDEVAQLTTTSGWYGLERLVGEHHMNADGMRAWARAWKDAALSCASASIENNAATNIKVTSTSGKLATLSFTLVPGGDWKLTNWLV